ncbi:MAG: ABC transporter ATP-binding protein [Candidatus Humimicrobiia bacterium]
MKDKKVLEVRKISKHFGGIFANKDISFDIYEGEIISLIGPNGAGKTTLFNLINGIEIKGQSRFPDEGYIKFLGKDITKERSCNICRMGIGRAFQIVQLLEELSALENVIIGAFVNIESIYKAKEEALVILDFIGLYNKRNYMVGELTIADKKLLEMARALATNPKLLMLDEVMAGLTPVEFNEIAKKIKEINKTGVTIMLIEHIMQAVMAVSDRIIVLDKGAKIADGPPEEIVKNKKVIKAYLGSDENVRG